MPIDHKLLATEIDRSTVAELIGLSQARVSALEKDGIITANANGKFVLKQVVQAHEKYLIGRVSNERAIAQTELARLRIKETQMRIDERAGKLVDAVEMQDAYWETVGAMHARCMSVPSRFSRDRKVREDLERCIQETVCDPTLSDLKEGKLKLARLRSIGGHE